MIGSYYNPEVSYEIKGSFGHLRGNGEGRAFGSIDRFSNYASP